jgi:stringent starvation protein B
MTDAPPQEPRASKPAVVRALLEHGSVYVHLDARVPEVEVPPTHRDDFRLVLQLGHGLEVLIPDLDIGDDFLVATLSFGRRPFRCRVPWRAVFAVTSEGAAGMVWPESFPPEVRREVIRAADAHAAAGTRDDAEPPKRAARGRARARRAPSKSSAANAPVAPPVAERAPAAPQPVRAAARRDPTPPPPARQEIRRGHLRLVK